MSEDTLRGQGDLPTAPWLSATRETVNGYRRMIDAALAQLSDAQCAARPRPDLNSVNVLLRHLAGNLQSRWTDFPHGDGEKPTRDRDLEFEDWTGTDEELRGHFDASWRRFEAALAQLSETDLLRTVMIRGEAHTVPQAIQRSITHVAYHVGQLLLVARLVGDADEWRWLTIPPGQSRAHNDRTWGTPASRGVAGGEPPPRA